MGGPRDRYRDPDAPCAQGVSRAISASKIRWARHHLRAVQRVDPLRRCTAARIGVRTGAAVTDRVGSPVDGAGLRRDVRVLSTWLSCPTATRSRHGLMELDRAESTLIDGEAADRCRCGVLHPISACKPLSVMPRSSNEAIATLRAGSRRASLALPRPPANVQPPRPPAVGPLQRRRAVARERTRTAPASSSAHRTHGALPTPARSGRPGRIESRGRARSRALHRGYW